MFGLLNHWGMAVRHSELTNKDTFLSGSGYFSWTEAASQQRTSADVEVGRFFYFGRNDLGHVGLVGGLRIAKISNDTSYSSGGFDAFTGAYIEDYREAQGDKFMGAGPRLGLRARVPIYGGFGVNLSGSGAALFGTRETSYKSQFLYGGYRPRSEVLEFRDWLINAEGSVSLSYLPSGVGGLEFAAGVRAEGWFNEYMTTANDFRSRTHWGPFAKVSVPFGGN